MYNYRHETSHVKFIRQVLNGRYQFFRDAASTTEFAPLHDTKLWKKINKHTNKKKREKTRRLYAHLDQHWARGVVVAQVSVAFRFTFWSVILENYGRAV